ncbi:MAG: hypothetical protein VXZ40_02215 [Nanoarchaeota archaeon]|nr:hypothetical protein [Nanoarchaeota archaeon]
MSQTKCPTCGNYKKPWFPLCWECSEKENQKPTCDVCDIEVPEGHNLCKEHWLEKQEASKKIKKADLIKKKQEENFREKYEGIYYFNNIKFKSKSEVIIYLFLKQNGLNPYYEEKITIDNIDLHPDFIVDIDENKSVIIEHFGLEDLKYKHNMESKKEKYSNLCRKNKNFDFVYTTEEDIKNLKDKLGSKLNNTLLAQTRWK